MATRGPLDLRGTVSIHGRQALGFLGKLRGHLSAIGAKSGLTAIAGGFRNAGTALAGFGSQLRGLAGPLAGLAGLGVGFGLVAAVQGFANATDEAAKFGRTIGLTAQEMRELDFVADRQGANYNKVKKGLFNFRKALDEARNGQGTLRTFLEKSNPELLKQLTNTQSLSEQMEILSNAYTDMRRRGEDGAGMLNAFFGGAARDWSKILQADAKELRGLRNEARFFMGVIGAESAAKVEAYKDSVTNLQAAFRGIGDAIGEKVLPVLTPLLNDFAKWLATNRELISTKVAQWVDETVASLRSIDWAAVGQQMSDLRDAFLKFADAVGGLDNVLIGFAAFMAGPFIASAALAGWAILKLGALILASPIGIALAAIGAAAYAATADWENFSAAMKRIWEGVKNVIGGAADFITNLVAGDFKASVDGLSRIWDGVGDIWGGKIDALKSLVRGFAKRIDQWFGTDTVAKVETMFDGVAAAWSTAIEGIKARLNEWAKWLESSWVGRIGSAINKAAGVLGRLTGLTPKAAANPAAGAPSGGSGGPSVPSVKSAPRPVGPRSSSILRNAPGGPGGGGVEKKHAALEINIKGAPATTKFSDASAGSPMFDDVKINRGRNMRSAPV